MAEGLKDDTPFCGRVIGSGMEAAGRCQLLCPRKTRRERKRHDSELQGQWFPQEQGKEEAL